MNIIINAFEVSPFAKTGGLADVTYSLASEFDALGHNVIVIMPKLKSINVTSHKFERLNYKLEIQMGFSTEYAAILEGKVPNSNAKVYLVEHDEYYSRDSIYGSPEEYMDNDRRFIFLSRAVFEVAKVLDFTPDVIHAHDYHTAFTLAFLKSFYKFEERFSKCAGVFTIHNLSFQGKYNPYRVMDFSSFGMKEFYEGSWFEKDGVVNCMKVGIMFADKITTVSPNYANEIRMAYYSEGLQDVLNDRGGDLIGVLNGVYYPDWNPTTDSRIAHNYTPKTIDKKKKNKYDFLKSFGLKESDNLDMPLFGMVSRLTEQKGIDIIKDKLDYYLENKNIRFLLLGSGQQDYVEFFNYLKWKYPKNAFIHIGYDESLAHRIFASSDFIMVPSRFEPCGLTQMYALKYGTIPLVRATGGLVDTVSEYNTETKKGTGFVFNNFHKDDFAYALERALSVYYSSEDWEKLKQNAMEEDFSSVRQAIDYIDVFEWALEKVK